jgi:hypothetical protein
MPRCLLFAFALIAAPAYAQPLAADATAPSPLMPPAQVIEQFHHDEINLLALRADAHSLLAAALMAREDSDNPNRPAALKTPALLERAAKAEDADALVWAVLAAIAPCAKDAPCPDAEHLAQLEKAEPDNAQTWLWALHRAQQAGDTVTARAALTSAAQSTRYDDHFGALTALLYDAAGILPIGESVLQASNQPGVSAAGFRLTYAAGNAIALPEGYLADLRTLCKQAPDDASIAADCVAVAQKMLDCGSLAARGIGVALWLELNPDGAAHVRGLQAQRSLQWRMSQISERAQQLANDGRITEVYIRALKSRGQEIDAVDAVLQRVGVALEPPANWQPATSNAAPNP